MKNLPIVLALICLTAPTGNVRALADGAPVPVKTGAMYGALDDAAPGLRGTLPIPVVVEPALSSLDHSKGQQWRRASMELAGSMCPACLLDLENKLKRIDGVAFTKIDRHAGLVAQNEPAPKEHTAAMVLIYDAHATKFAPLLECIKGEKYEPLNLDETDK